MVNQKELRDKLQARLAEIADALSFSDNAFVVEIFGEGSNALYKVLSFPTKERFQTYLIHCDFVSSANVFMTKTFRTYFVKSTLHYSRPQYEKEKIHVLILCSSTG
jgi:hypothetical protein